MAFLSWFILASPFLIAILVVFVAVVYFLHVSRNPKQVVGRIREEQLEEKKRLQSLNGAILTELRKEEQLEEREKKKLGKLKAGKILIAKLFPRSSHDEVAYIRNLCRKAMRSQRKTANGIYRDVYAIYQKLPKSKQKSVHGDVVAVYNKVVSSQSL